MLTTLALVQNNTPMPDKNNDLRNRILILCPRPSWNNRFNLVFFHSPRFSLLNGDLLTVVLNNVIMWESEKLHNNNAQFRILCLLVKEA